MLSLCLPEYSLYKYARMRAHKEKLHSTHNARLKGVHFPSRKEIQKIYEFTRPLAWRYHHNSKIYAVRIYIRFTHTHSQMLQVSIKKKCSKIKCYLKVLKNNFNATVLQKKIKLQYQVLFHDHQRRHWHVNVKPTNKLMICNALYRDVHQICTYARALVLNTSKFVSIVEFIFSRGKYLIARW